MKIELDKDQARGHLWEQWNNLSDSIPDISVMRVIMQNDIKLSKEELQSYIKEYKVARAQFEKVLERADFLAKETIKHAHEHMIDSTEK